MSNSSIFSASPTVASDDENTMGGRSLGAPGLISDGPPFLEANHSFRKGWWIHTLDTVNSTSTAAAKLPAWHAVRAIMQSEGRGRTGRRWISDRGGLWLSAVMPCPANEAIWRFLPLVAGMVVARLLRDMGVPRLRLRWPNDLMVGRMKLAGILVERFSVETAVIGIGINVSNTPATIDSDLLGTSARLDDYLSGHRSLEELTVLILSAFRSALHRLESRGVPSLAEELNASWVEPHQVELTLRDEAVVQGRFIGVDRQGGLRLATTNGVERCLDAIQVVLLRELD